MGEVNLYGRIFIRGDIRAITGLHIGGSQAAMSIGSVDNPIIRDPLSGKPYIPGSSLRGKMRSLWEKATGADANRKIGRDVWIHTCKSREAYENCPVCATYGVPGETGADKRPVASAPTRLIVRDLFLSKESGEELNAARTDLPYAEVKWEAAIDRVTSAATPRQIERVPAGTLFSGFEMVFSVYEEADLPRFLQVIEAMQLLEDDYLGGSGSRGSGKIAFQNVQISVRATRSGDGYGREVNGCPASGRVSALLDKRDEIGNWLKENISFSNNHD